MIEKVFEFLKEYWSRIKDAPQNVGIALFISILLIKPMFQLNIISGLLYMAIMFWIFIQKVEIFLKYPKYSIIIFVILSIRWAIGDVRGKGLNFFGSGEIVSGIIYLAVYIVIYLKTKELEIH